jgi:hypothetical protein
MGNPLANVLVIIVGALAVGASIVLGVVAFVTLGSLVLIMAAVIGIRLWWMKRKFRKDFASDERSGPARPGSIDIIEGEFKVVTKNKENDSDS